MYSTEQRHGIDVQQLREHAVLIAREAADLVSRIRSSAVTDVSTKSSETDVVTAGDRASERLIRQRLHELWPQAAVLGEEEGGEAPGPGLCWVVDPIDGTVNYLYGYPYYAVSIAAVLDGESVAGVVLDPVSGRTWSAAKGQGADLNGQRLTVNPVSRLDLSMIATGFSYQPERRARQAAVWATMLPRVRDIRRAGSAATDLCAVATGWIDGYVEHGLNHWDWAAGALIAAEAGVVVRVPGTNVDDGLGADATFAVAPGIADELRTALVAAGAGDI